MKKYEKFYMALDNLKDIYNYREPYDNVISVSYTHLDVYKRQEFLFKLRCKEYFRGDTGAPLE